MFQLLQLRWRAGKSISTRDARLSGGQQKRGQQQFLRPRLEPLEERCLLTLGFLYEVTTEKDIVDPHDNLTSLREAVALANDRKGFDTIEFDNSLASKPLMLLNGPIGIADTVTIQGLGAGLMTINGQNASRLFDIANTAGDVTFDGLALTGGKTTADLEQGGAIRSASPGQLTIQNSIIFGNSTGGAYAYGGGVFASGPATVTNSTIFGNSTVAYGAAGGGVYSADSVTVTNSTVSGNSTAGGDADGGGIYSLGAAAVIYSTISGNSTTGDVAKGGGGGGLNAYGSVTVTDSTIAGNSTAGTGAYGGGIFAYGSLLVTNSTIVGNLVTTGYGPGSGVFAGGGGVSSFKGPVTIRNSIVAGNYTNGSDPDVGSSATLAFPLTLTVQFSLIGDNNGTDYLAAPVGTPDSQGNLIGTHAAPLDPLLGPLKYNGGSTQTRGPRAGSPVIDAGNNALAVDPATQAALITDQRGLGFDRILNNTVDIGAFESQLTFSWHNFTLGFADDVVGATSVQPDGHIVAGDVIAIINYINAKGSGPIPANVAVGLPFGFLDTDKDNNVTASDVIHVINFINAHPSQSEAEANDPPSDLISLLAFDIADQAVRRRRVQ